MQSTSNAPRPLSMAMVMVSMAELQQTENALMAMASLRLIHTYHLVPGFWFSIPTLVALLQFVSMTGVHTSTAEGWTLAMAPF
jgi:hypothetical protein